MSEACAVRRSRVLLVSNGYPPTGHWGTEFYTRELARALRARDHEVVVFCPRREGARPRYTLAARMEEGVEIVEIQNAGDPRKRFEDSWRNERVAEAFGKLVAERKPAVVHFLHLLWGLSVDLPAVARAAGCATVATATDYGLLCHRGQFRDWRERDCGGPSDASVCARCVREPGNYDAQPLQLAAKRLAVRALAACGGAGLVVVPRDIERRRAAVREACATVDRWIAPTRSMERTLLAHGWPAERLEQFVYGIDERDFALPRRADGDGPCLGFIGQFAPHKGAAQLFEAVRILERDPDVARLPWRLEMWGHPLGDRYQRYIDAHSGPDLERRVRFMGAFEPARAPFVMSRFDVLCVPSQWDENAPLAVLQARAAGLPVVASDVPGVREALEGVPSVLVPKQDAAAFAAALRGVLLAGDPSRLAPAPATTMAAHMRRVEAVYEAAQAAARRGSASAVARAAGG